MKTQPRAVITLWAWPLALGAMMLIVAVERYRAWRSLR
jgi:hypothetical protein